QGAVMQEQGERIDQVYFPHDGIVSLLAVMRQGDAIETATIGYEGAVGSFAGLGMRRAHTRAVVQVSGSASRIAASRFRKVAEESEAVCRIVVRYGEMMLIQVQQTAACNALHPVEARLSRWLLQASDRLESNSIKLTHEFLSQMLGVRRTTVTVVANMLQQAGASSVIIAATSESSTDAAARREPANATRPFGGTSKKSRRREGKSARHRVLHCDFSWRPIGSAAWVRYPTGARRLVPALWRPVFGATAQGRRMAAKSDSKVRVIAHNRKARFNYQIGETFEAGLALNRTEVKSLRGGRATIAEAYADSRGGEIWLVNANIPEYLQGGRFNHAPKRVRKLLLHRRQINKLMGAVEREGMTLVPLKLYFNEKGRAKLELALARGKKLHDKGETEKRRGGGGEGGRLLRAKG